MGRTLNPITNGYTRVQLEMDKILLNNNYDVKISYHYYKQPKTIIDHFYKRLIWYPKMLRKSENDYNVNHIIVQHLSDLARKLNPDRTILHLLDIYNFINRKGIRNNWLMNRRRLKELRKCKHIIAISEFSKNEAIEKLGIDKNRITVIKCGVNRDVFHPIDIFYPIVITNSDKFSILHIGTESGRKGFITLLYALKEITKYNPDIILYRVGKPEYKKEIKKMDLESKIKYISEISDEDLNILYNSVDLFVFPSSYEGYGLPIMEALSCGTPVICSDIPVFKEIYGDSVMYFPVNDYISLTDEILKFSMEKEHKLLEKGINLAKENTWEKYANQYFNYIKQRFG